jgi:5-methylcytosine-specific restriction endonuclease McrA
MEQKVLSGNDLTIANKRFRGSKEYKDFVKSILERDNWTCNRCGISKFNTLYPPPIQVHHINSFYHYPELRLEPSNCICLCKPCHKLTDTYVEGVNIPYKTPKPSASDLNFWY